MNDARTTSPTERCDAAGYGGSATTPTPSTPPTPRNYDWIAVADELPAPHWVLISWRGKSQVAYARYTGRHWESVDDHIADPPPTHWRYLPDPPPSDPFSEWWDKSTPSSESTARYVGGDLVPKRAARLVWSAAIAAMQGE